MLKRLRLFAVVFGIVAVAVLSGCSEKRTTDSGPKVTALPDKKAPVIKTVFKFDSIAKMPGAQAGTLKGGGATFPEPLYRAWFEAYRRTMGIDIGYDGAGSATGVKRFSTTSLDFGATDACMTDAQLQEVGRPVLHIPTALGAVVVAYNVPELQKSDVRLKLTGENLAAIFSGTIKNWNDPALVADNPALQSVNQPIITLHRRDGSGTTYVFSDYLSTVDKVWRGRTGSGTSIYWPVGMGVEQTSGMADQIKLNEYSIGYLDLNVSVQKGLQHAAVKNAAGQFVDPSVESIAAAAGGVQLPKDLRFSLVNATAKGAYPLCTATWIVVSQEHKEQGRANALVRILWWVTHEGQSANTELNFAPLSPDMVARCEELLKTVNVNGKPVIPK